MQMMVAGRSMNAFSVALRCVTIQCIMKPEDLGDYSSIKRSRDFPMKIQTLDPTHKMRAHALACSLHLD